MKEITYLKTILAILTILLAISIGNAIYIHADPCPEVPPTGEEIAQVEEAPQLVSLGEFTIYHYCPCAKCCGKAGGITATGTAATEYRTIAVDPEIIPLGSRVLILDEWHIAEDVGGGIKGNTVDVFVADHNRALEMGKYTAEVFMLKEGAN